MCMCIYGFVNAHVCMCSNTHTHTHVKGVSVKDHISKIRMDMLKGWLSG